MQITTWFGSIELSENGELQSFNIFDKDPQLLVSHILTLESDKNLVPKGFDLRQIAIECGFVELEEDYDILLRDVCIKAAKNQISTHNSDDKRIVQAVEAMDDIDKAANELVERLNEWYGVYFPELNLNNEAKAYFVSEFGSKGNVPEGHKFFSLASSSMGADLSLPDEDLIRNFANSLCGLYDTRKHLEQYIMDNMSEIAVNLTDIAGAPIGARLISLAGGLEKLATFPSSTIQVIGAHNALFKHLHARAPSPKHGIIYNHPLVKGAPWWQRGKIARILAAKISLAIRMDVYGNKFDPAIKTNLNSKITNIKKVYAEPPKKKSAKVTKSRRSNMGMKHSNKKWASERSKR